MKSGLMMIKEWNRGFWCCNTMLLIEECWCSALMTRCSSIFGTRFFTPLSKITWTLVPLSMQPLVAYWTTTAVFLFFTLFQQPLVPSPSQGINCWHHLFCPACVCIWLWILWKLFINLLLAANWYYTFVVFLSLYHLAFAIIQFLLNQIFSIFSINLVGMLPTCCNMSWWHVVFHQFLADMDDMQISWLNELRLWHVTSCRVLSSTLLGDVFCHLFLLCVVTWQKSMLTWRHICHVDNESQNVACCWCCRCQACYGDIRQFQLSPSSCCQFWTISMPFEVIVSLHLLQQWHSYHLRCPR